MLETSRSRLPAPPRHSIAVDPARDRNERALARLPHVSIEHHDRERLRDSSRNAQRQVAAAHSFTRAQSPSSASRTAASRIAPVASSGTVRGRPSTSPAATATVSSDAEASPAAIARSPSRTVNAVASVPAGGRSGRGPRLPRGLGVDGVGPGLGVVGVEERHHQVGVDPSLRCRVTRPAYGDWRLPADITGVTCSPVTHHWRTR